jgi:hypothetical protein
MAFARHTSYIRHTSRDVSCCFLHTYVMLRWRRLRRWFLHTYVLLRYIRLLLSDRSRLCEPFQRPICEMGQTKTKQNQHKHRLNWSAGWWFGTLFIFPYTYIYIYWECHHPNWLSYFSRWLKPPSSQCRMDHPQLLVYGNMSNGHDLQPFLFEDAKLWKNRISTQRNAWNS